MYTLFIILHIFVSIFLILVVLVQGGKGAGMGAAFGGSTQTMFGGRGPTTFIQKMTAGMAILFMVLSVILATLSARGGSDLEAWDTKKPEVEAGMVQVPPTKADSKDSDLDRAKPENDSDDSKADQPEDEADDNP